VLEQKGSERERVAQWNHRGAVPSGGTSGDTQVLLAVFMPTPNVHAVVQGAAERGFTRSVSFNWIVMTLPRLASLHRVLAPADLQSPHVSPGVLAGRHRGGLVETWRRRR